MENMELIQILKELPVGRKVMLSLPSAMPVSLSSVSSDSEGIYLVADDSPEILNSNGDFVGTLDELIERDESEGGSDE